MQVSVITRQNPDEPKVTRVQRQKIIGELLLYYRRNRGWQTARVESRNIIERGELLCQTHSLDFVKIRATLQLRLQQRRNVKKSIFFFFGFVLDNKIRKVLAFETTYFGWSGIIEFLSLFATLKQQYKV